MLAAGHAKAGDTSFGVKATQGGAEYDICSTAFLEHAFRTDAFEMKVTINSDGA